MIETKEGTLKKVSEHLDCFVSHDSPGGII